MGYPPGAMYDDNAPYNQSYSPMEEFGDEARQTAGEEMSNLLHPFVEFCEDRYFLPDADDVEQKTTTRILKALAADSKVRKEYYEFRVENLAEEMYNERYCYED